VPAATTTRAVQTAHADGSLTFYCAIDEGIVLTLGEPVDQLESLNATMAEIREAVGEIDHIIAFDCVLNRINAERRQFGRPISKSIAATAWSVSTPMANSSTRCT
jgi:hypothetical protein